jgi:hypothetical protein
MLAVAGDGSWLSDGAEGWKLQIVSWSVFTKLIGLTKPWTLHFFLPYFKLVH